MTKTVYTNSTVTIPAPPDSVALVYKLPGAAPSRVASLRGLFQLPAGTAPGVLYFQFLNSNDDVIGADNLTIVQDLASVEADYDPRTDAEKTLEALDAKIAGRALTIQQTRISVGDRSIEYMNSIDELLKWREYFVEIVAKEHGHATPKNQVCKMVRA